MDLEKVELQLREVTLNFRDRDVAGLQTELARYKQEFVAKNDQAGAKQVWCLESILEIQENYIKAFEEIEQGLFYPAWCTFERIEIEYSFLKRHLPEPHSTYYYLNFIIAKTNQWQSLFPYRLFSSLEFIKKARKCLICEKPVSLRRPCGHLIGEIYDGRMCCHEITEIQLTGISLVTHPHCKYTVLFVNGEEPNDNVEGKYNRLIHVMSRLQSPFDDWCPFFGKAEVYRSSFKEEKRDSYCPCGSMQYFGDCCYGKDTLFIPWVHVEVGNSENYEIPEFLISDSPLQSVTTVQNTAKSF